MITNMIYALLRWLFLNGPKPVRNFISYMEYIEVEAMGEPTTLWEEFTGAIENMVAWHKESLAERFIAWWDEKIEEPYYTWKFRLFVWCSEDPKIAIIVRAYMDDEKVVTPGSREHVLAVNAWLGEMTGDPDPDLTWDKCEACQERESFYHAMSLDEMGMFLPEWAAGILAKYDEDDKPLPTCEHASK